MEKLHRGVGTISVSENGGGVVLPFVRSSAEKADTAGATGVEESQRRGSRRIIARVGNIFKYMRSITYWRSDNIVAGNETFHRNPVEVVRHVVTGIFRGPEVLARHAEDGGEPEIGPPTFAEQTKALAA